MVNRNSDEMNFMDFNIDEAFDTAITNDARLERCRVQYKEIAEKMVASGSMDGANKALFSYMEDFTMTDIIVMVSMMRDLHQNFPEMLPMVASVHAVTCILVGREEDANEDA